ncbi:MAG TPA: hypothetical protein ENH26_00370 [Candidatus Wolfebacteria bacterium]|nr:hypothetical protein [Candidatus Wolfebacteria bacterium]
MGKIIRSKINKNIEEGTWRKFLSQFKKDLSSEKLDEILSNLLSQQEKIVLARRLAVIFLMKQGKSYSAISQILGIGPQTISAVKKSIPKKFYAPYRQKQQKIIASPGRSFIDDFTGMFPAYKAYGYKKRDSRHS